MKTKAAAMTTVILLAMGTPLGAQASADFPDVDIDVAADSMIDEGMALKTTRIGVEQKIIFAKKINDRRQKPKKIK